MSEQPAAPDAERVPITGVIDGDRVVIVTPDGMGVATTDPDTSTGETESGQAQDATSERERPTNPADLVEQPAKVMRIGSMIKQLLEEVRNSPLDEKGRARLADIHERSISELKDGLAPELVEELERITLPFTEDAPSDAELRVAQAQLVGWLEGLFHGIQTALVAQQMAAQAQLQQMRQLPPGAGGAAEMPGMPGSRQDLPGTGPGGRSSSSGPHEGTGQYL